jgi:hypothetical protein
MHLQTLSKFRTVIISESLGFDFYKKVCVVGIEANIKAQKSPSQAKAIFAAFWRATPSKPPHCRVDPTTVFQHLSVNKHVAWQTVKITN